MFAGRSDVLMNYSELELSEVLYDGLVGGALGLIGSGAELVQRGKGAETPDVDAGARQRPAEGNFTPAQENAADGAQGASKGAVSANTNLFSRNILENFNHARTYFIDFAKKNFPTVVTNAETGRQIGISRKGLDKFLSGNIPYEKYASGFHIPELIENGHKVAEAGNYHPQTANSIPTFEYYDSPIKIDGEQYNAHIRVKNTNVGDKYYGHTISEVEDIKIEPPTRTTAEAVAPENTGGSTEAPSPASDGTSALSGDLDHVASGDASTDTVQAPVSLDPTVTQENGGVKGEDMQRGGNYAPSDGLGAADAGFDPFTAAQNEYGTLPSGEKPVRPDDAPRSTNGEDRVSQTVVTAKGAQVTPDEFVPLIENETMKGGFSFIPVSNNDVTQRATARISEKGWSRALADWTSDVRAGKAGDSITATGALLYNYAVNSGYTGLALSVLSDYAAAVRNSARGLQAARIMKTLTPSNRLYMMEQDIRNLAERLGITDGLHLDKELAQQYLDAQDDAARDKIIEDIQQDVADQIPSTLLDKWTAWRYVNMLGNFKTQGRNIVGNVGMQAVQRAKDGIATAIESIAYHASGGKFERTKSFTVDKALRDAAKTDFKNVEAAALGEGKYHEGSDSDAFLRGVEKRRTIFKNNGDWGTTESSNPFVRAARITTDTAAKGLEGYRRATNWAMEQGDVIFSKGAYAHALAGYLKAHQVTADQFSSAEWQSRNGSFVDKARLYAIKEAQESTFRDSNTLKTSGRETPS